MRSAIRIAIKDLRARSRDRSVYILGIVAPLSLALIFSFLYGADEDVAFAEPFVVADEDGGPVASLFSEGVLGDLEERGLIELTRVATAARAHALVDKDVDPMLGGGVNAAWVIPEGFSETIQTEQPAELQVIVNAGASDFAAGAAVAIANEFASEMNYVRLAVGTVETLGQPADRLAAGVRAMEITNPVAITEVEADSKQLDAKTYVAAGMAIFFLFFTIQFGVKSLVEEREAGTLQRLLVAPIREGSIIGGKALGAAIAGLVSMAVLVVATTQLFGADWGPPVGVILLVVAAIAAAIGILAIAAAFAKTSEQAELVSSAIALVLGFLGGTFVQISESGSILSQAKYVTPHAWFLRGLGDLSGGEIAAIAPAVTALLIFAAAGAAIAAVGLRRGLRS